MVFYVDHLAKPWCVTAPLFPAHPALVQCTLRAARGEGLQARPSRIFPLALFPRTYQVCLAGGTVKDEPGRTQPPRLQEVCDDMPHMADKGHQVKHLVVDGLARRRVRVAVAALFAATSPPGSLFCGPVGE